MANLLIPCSGPGTRSTGYTKFHKALIRVGNCAVIDHIINSYTKIDEIYVMLGFQGDLIREYLQHVGYTNINFIEIANWQTNQIASFQQIPRHVFTEPFYYNACDNWTSSVPAPRGNTYYTCKPEHSELYDSDGDSVYSGIAYIQDSIEYYNILQEATITRNDLLLYQQLGQLNSCELEDWYDVGNSASYLHSAQQYQDKFLVLDKTHQEVYQTRGRIVKLFENKPTIDFDNVGFPHPQPVKQTDNAISYDFVPGKVNPYNGDFQRLQWSLLQMWNFCIANNSRVYNTELWQDKTWQRFNMMIEQCPEFAQPIVLNGVEIDPTRVIESLPWDTIYSGIQGPTHGDLVLDNIVVGDDSISYIDHRQGSVNDIFYDIAKFYHSLYLHNRNLAGAWNLTQHNNEYTINLELDDLDTQRIGEFTSTPLYTHSAKKIELCVGCIWLSMAPLNVDQQLNKFLFLLAMQKFGEYNELL